MATYAVGDVQGCARQLEHLLDAVRFDAGRDRVWFTGDLVNRGPDSLRVLEIVAGLGEAAVAVLGNHDLHLVARGLGLAPARPGDTLDDVLGSPAADRWVKWLLERPLAHREGRWLLVHAGLLPGWGPDTAEAAARQLERELREGDAAALLARAGASDVHRWRDDLPEVPRLRLALRALVSIRYVDRSGAMVLGPTEAPAQAPPGLVPWFEHPSVRFDGVTVVFGHWSTLGLKRNEHLLALDTGCVWGGPLTAVRLEDGRVFQVEGRR